MSADFHSRTGITTQHRKCPRHGTALEAFVEHSSCPSHLRWWCDECGGTWPEEYFAMRVEASLPVMALEWRFKVACPQCHGPRVTGACEFECCDMHRCTDCGQKFFIDRVIRKKSPLPKAAITALKEKAWLEGGSLGGRAPFAKPKRGTPRDLLWETVQTTGLCNWCPGYDRWGPPDDAPTVSVLRVNGWPPDERYRFAWVCLECGKATSVYSHKWDFTQETRPDYRCRVCHHVTFDQAEDWREATCVTCGTEFRLRAKLHVETWPTESK